MGNSIICCGDRSEDTGKHLEVTSTDGNNIRKSHRDVKYAVASDNPFKDKEIDQSNGAP